MARTSKVTFSAGRTINQGKFNSFRLDVGEEVEIESGDDVTAEKAAMKARVFAELEETAKPFLDYAKAIGCL